MVCAAFHYAFAYVLPERLYPTVLARATTNLCHLLHFLSHVMIGVHIRILSGYEWVIIAFFVLFNAQ
jgi:hypothetical protein